MTVPRYQWQPSTAEIARRAGIAPAEVIRFDHNTSPYAAPWSVEEAATAAAGLNEYPAADYLPLRTAAARLAGVEPEMVVPGAGVDEMIDLCARALIPPGGRAVASSPTYTLYRIATMRRGARYDDVPRAAPGLGWPGEALAGAAAAADLTWLCVPDNPFGDRPDDGEIDRVLTAAAGIVVIDAAYAEFADDRWAPWLERHPHLVVLHTMSKAFGLAGIRVGYSLSSPDIAMRLDAVRPPGSVSSVSAALAIRALEEPEYVKGIITDIWAARAELAGRLAGLGWAVRPSVANFLLCEVGPEAPAIEAALMARGIVVRAFAAGPLAEYLRFTVRSPAEHDRLFAELERIL